MLIVRIEQPNILANSALVNSGLFLTISICNCLLSLKPLSTLRLLDNKGRTHDSTHLSVYIPLQSTISTNQLGIQPRFFLASLIRYAISEGAFRWTEALHFWQSKETWIFASMLASTLPVSWIYIAKITLNISRFFWVKKCLFGV